MGTGQKTYPVNKADTTNVVNSSAGASDADKLIKTDARGKVAGSLLSGAYIAGESISGATLPVPVFLPSRFTTLAATNTGSTRKIGDDTTNYRCQSFTTGSADNYLAALTLKLHKDGSPTGNATIDVYAASGDNPTGASLGQITVDVATLTAGAVDYRLLFATPIAVSPSTKYVYRIFYNGDASNYINITDSNTGYSGGVESYSNDGTSWTAQTGYDMYFIFETYTFYPGRVFKTDANDTTRLKFDGFAVTTATAGNAISVIREGVVSGFTGLITGVNYFVQDAIGTIGTTIGTYGILVGQPISATELQIDRGSNQLVGVQSIAFSGASSYVFTMPDGATKAIFMGNTWSWDSGVNWVYNSEVTIIRGSLTSNNGLYVRSGSFSSNFFAVTLSGNTLTVGNLGSGAGNVGNNLTMYYYR